jgi:cell division septation protein DedD
LLIGLFIALSITGLTWFFLRHPFYKARIGQQETHDKTVAKAIQVPIGKPDNSEPPTPTTLSTPIGPSEEMPGFVLQAGAMALEENAKALAESLRQRNFPAFMVKSGFNHLYRVYVGPYPDRHSAVDIDTELAHQGFTGILKSWSPSSKPEYRSAISLR